MNLKKIGLLIACTVICCSSCREKIDYYDYSGVSYECATVDLIGYENLFNHCDYVYMIKLGKLLGKWTSPNKSLSNYGKFDVWGYSIIETYKGNSDNYYMFFLSKDYTFKGVPEFVTGSYYYVFLKDYSYLDERCGFPDYFIAPDFCLSPGSIIAA